jgi:hypothetical protein
MKSPCAARVGPFYSPSHMVCQNAHSKEICVICGLFPLGSDDARLISPGERKTVPCFEARIFPVSQRQPSAGEGSAEGTAVRVFLESQPLERPQEFGRD